MKLLTTIISTVIFANAISAAPQINHGQKQGLHRRGNFSVADDDKDDWAGAVITAPPDGDSFVTVIGSMYSHNSLAIL
jgi:hypothetical protein